MVGWLIAGGDVGGLFFFATQVVLAPIVIGMMTNKFFPKAVKAVLPVTPVVGVLATCFLVASAVAQARFWLHCAPSVSHMTTRFGWCCDVM